ncbi:4659_t:CDS:2 [Ambispora leptoticha]|uniref:4659_t:CDS:1 n=1 Tax=Ambispora leptoticha TaxID=144679 RepID=A0A9N9CA36_9GLOM|nr:4659_t:CDS:2 [Ambispora leptoticha]
MTTANSPHSGTSHQNLSESSNSNTNSASSSSGRTLPMSTNHTASTPAPIMFKTINSPPPMSDFTDNATTNNGDKAITNQTSTTINGQHQPSMNPTALNSSKLALSFIATSPVALEASTASIIATSSVPNESIITVQNVGNRGRKRSSTTISEDSMPMSIEDEIAIKRMKNTEAARRSRLRKAQRMEALEQEISELKSENSRLQTRVAVLESEKASLREKSLEKDARVRQLEQQLSEAYERLVKRDPSSSIRILDDCEKYQTVAIGKASFNSESSPPLVID